MSMRYSVRRAFVCRAACTLAASAVLAVSLGCASGRHTRVAGERVVSDDDSAHVVIRDDRPDPRRLPAAVAAAGDHEEAVIEAEVADRLRTYGGLTAAHVSVSVEDGVVYLTGRVGTPAKRDRASELAEHANGVLRVVNQIGVGRDWVYKSDAELLKDTVNEIEASPYVESEHVHVAVQNGQVTLTGTVESHAERFAAEHNAYEGGARTVRNLLRINPWLEVDPD